MRLRVFLTTLVLAAAACSVEVKKQPPPCKPSSPVLFNGAVWGGNVAIDSGEVYFTTFQDEQGNKHHAVRGVSSCGGSASVVVDAEPGDIFGFGMAVRGGRLFWSQNDANGVPGIYSGPTTAGGARSLLASFHTMMAPYAGVAVDDARVYAANFSEILSVPIAGGPSTTLYSGNVEWGTVLRGNTLYFTADQALQRVDVSGGAPTKIAAIDSSARGRFDVDASYAYLTSQSSVVRVALDGSGSAVLSNGLDSPAGAVLAPGYVLTVVASQKGNALVRIPIGGGTAETVYDGLGAGGNQMVVDKSTVYLAYCCGANGGAVLRIDLPPQ